MNVPIYHTPKQRLYLETCAVIRAMRESSLSRGSAEARLYATVVDGADLVLEMIGKEQMMQFVSEHITEVEQRDFDGGGIGLRPVTKTGGDAVADEAGQSENDSPYDRTRPSAPQSQTPAEMPVGGGQDQGVPQGGSASTTTHTTVREHPRRLPTAPIDAPRPATAGVWSKANIEATTKAEPRVKAPYIPPKPRTSMEARMRVKNSVAMSILDKFMFRRRPIGDWTHEELAKVAEESGREHRIATAFMQVTPAGTHVREYVKPEAAEAIILSLGLEVAGAS